MNLSMILEDHNRFNEDYVNGKLECKDQMGFDTGKLTSHAVKRLDLFKNSLANIPESELSSGAYVEVTDNIISMFDDIIVECALLNDKRAQVESLIFNLCKTTLLELENKADSASSRKPADEHVSLAFVDPAVNNKPAGEKAYLYRTALLHDTNPLRLGMTFYEEFCVDNPDFADGVLLDYLRIEQEVRFLLISGRNPKIVDALSALFAHPINTSEKYLLMALNCLNFEQEKDAARTIEIGLNTFGNSVRLKMAMKNFQ